MHLFCFQYSLSIVFKNSLRIENTITLLNISLSCYGLVFTLRKSVLIRNTQVSMTSTNPNAIFESDDEDSSSDSDDDILTSATRAASCLEVCIILLLLLFCLYTHSIHYNIIVYV